jgi:hypothetical protein
LNLFWWMDARMEPCVFDCGGMAGICSSVLGDWGEM